jgi:DNA-binding MarR family transcriptional regulator
VVGVSAEPARTSVRTSEGDGSTHNDLVRAYLDVVSLSDGLQVRVWREAELTLAQLRMLRRLSRRSMTVGQLGVALSLSSTSVTKMLDRLEVRGLIERRRDDNDRRRVGIVLLPAGRELLSVLPIPAGSSIQTAVDAMPEARRIAITKAMREFASAVRHQLEERDTTTLRQRRG